MHAHRLRYSFQQQENETILIIKVALFEKDPLNSFRGYSFQCFAGALAENFHVFCTVLTKTPTGIVPPSFGLVLRLVF